METDLAYFIRRAAEERGAATRATHPTARAAHVEMAERYEDMARAIGPAHRAEANAA